MRFSLRVALLAFASVALCAAVMKHRADLLKPHIIQDTGAMWLFPTPGTRIDFHASSREALLIKDWITTHQTGWKFSSTGFDPDKTQLICGTYGIQLVDDMILLDYYKHKDDDPDSAIQLERILSPDEQAFWQSLIRQIRQSFPAERYRDWHVSPHPPNQSMKPTAPLRNASRVLATIPCRGLSLSR
jgi:hypothetical protein